MLTGATLPTYMGKHHLFMAVRFEWTDHFALDNAAMANLEDGSFYFNHGLNLLFFKNIDLTLETSWILGERNKSEFGLAPEQITAGLKAVVYF